ncbi:MAG TPA: MraY family glycosyltransferase [Fimbriimonadaceae bacterium]|nr:MraY family glycosyltransferase [Fimbriimonadaceae bacterium]
MIESLLLLTKVESPSSGFGYPLATGLMALLVTYMLTPLVRKLAFAKGAVDDPKRDDRRIHKKPLPRWGGMGIYAGIVIALAVVLPFAFPLGTPYPPYLIGVVLIGGLLVFIGALDDLYQFSAKLQLLILLAAGVAVQFFYTDAARIQVKSIGVPLTHPHQYIVLGAAAIPLTAIYIFIVTKTMDTIDGVDGLAAGIATISAATLVIIAVYGHQPRVAIIAAAIAGASLGFLRHNYNPATIIMGTGGAYILGFMLACISIVGAFKTAAAIAMVIPVCVFGVPLFDAMQVVIRRKLSGVPITQADKRHVHHALLSKGLSQRQTVLVLYAAALLLCGVLLIVIKRYG